MSDIARHNPAALESVIIMITFYLHLGAFAKRVVADLDRQIAAEDTKPSVYIPQNAPVISQPAALAHYG